MRHQPPISTTNARTLSNSAAQIAKKMKKNHQCKYKKTGRHFSAEAHVLRTVQKCIQHNRSSTQHNRISAHSQQQITAVHQIVCA